MVEIASGGEVGGEQTLSALARVRLTGELAGLTGRLTDGRATPITRIKIASRMAEIIRQLGNVVSMSEAIRAEGESEVSRLYSEWSSAKSRVEQKSFGDRQIWLSESQVEQVAGMMKSYAKRAERLGVAAIAMEVLDSRMVQWWYRKDEKKGMAMPVGEKEPRGYSVKGEIEKQQLVRIKGELPVLSGWKFLGKIDHDKSGNIIRQVGDTPVPARYQSSASYCEHCNKLRNRLATYVMQGPDGEVKQVGSSCINDFLGHGDAESIASLAEYLSSFWTQLEAIGNAESDPDNEGGGGRPERYLDLIDFLVLVAYSVRKHGWISRKTAEERGGISTADNAVKIMLRPGDSQPVPTTAEDKAMATAAIEFAKNITDEQAQAETFLSNIRVIARDGAVKMKNAGFAAAIVNAYQRVLEEAARKKAQQDKPSEWQGTIGKRETFKGLTVESIKALDGQYGTTYIHHFRDESGNVFVWFASGTSLEKGRTYDIAASVKKHDDYKGVKQTVITRANPQNMRLDKPEDQSLFKNVEEIAASATSEADFMAQFDALNFNSVNDANMANLALRVGYGYWPIKNYDAFLASVRAWYVKNYGDKK